MLFKWFLVMNILDAGFNHSVFSKNKERLLRADVSREFFREIVDQARDRGLLSDEHFSVYVDEEIPTEGRGRSTARGRRTQSSGRLSWGAQGERNP